jgi:hypothetical protein
MLRRTKLSQRTQSEEEADNLVTKVDQPIFSMTTNGPPLDGTLLQRVEIRFGRILRRRGSSIACSKVFDWLSPGLNAT